MMFSYLLPLTMILTLLLIIIFAEKLHYYCSCTLPCEEVNTIRAILFVLVVPYQAIIRITLKILKIVEINGAYRVADFAVLQYMEGDHLYYAITAILLLTFVVVLPFSLVIPNTFCTRYRLITPLLEGFLSVFQNNLVCHLFCAFYFLFRLILLLMSTFLKRDQFQLTLMASLCFIMFLLFAKVRPYRNDIYNYFDIVILFNLTVIGFLINGKLRLSLWENTDIYVNQTIMVLLWVPFVMWPIALIVLYWLTRRSVFERVT